MVTTLIDADVYSKEKLADLFRRRWEIETNFAHLKTTMKMDVLKCKTVEGVLKELDTTLPANVQYRIDSNDAEDFRDRLMLLPRDTRAALLAASAMSNPTLDLVEQGATHIGVATDHVIESFRNDLWAGYKTGEGVDPALKAQFWPLEDALRSMGVVTWAMVDHEAAVAVDVGFRIRRALEIAEADTVATPTDQRIERAQGFHGDHKEHRIVFIQPVRHTSYQRTVGDSP